MRWMRLLRKSRTEEDLDKELRFHVEQQISSYVAGGLSPEDARRKALIEFGGLERVKEEVRGTRWETRLDALFLDIRRAVRDLLKNPRFALAAILTLALGIGSATVVFSAFYNLLFHALAARDSDRLVVPLVQDSERPGSPANLLCTLSDLELIRTETHVFENVVGYIWGGIVLFRDGGRTYQMYDSRVTADAFDFYGVPPLIGRGILPEDGKPGAPLVFVVSYDTWKSKFDGDLADLGKSYVVDGEPRTLVGVMPPRFRAFGAFSRGVPELIWTPIPWAGSTTSSGNELYLLARLKRGVSLEAATADLGVVESRLALLHPQEFPKHFTARIQTATEYLTAPSATMVFRTDLRHMLYGLLAAVMMLLLISCSNVGNLLLARATVREREMAVRCALGASRRRLVFQLLAESFVLAAAGCLLGCAFAWLGLKSVNTLIEQRAWGNLPIESVIGLDVPVLAFALGTAILTTVICGLAPVAHLGRTDLQPLLAGGGKGLHSVFRSGRLRAGLVIGEVALSLVLAIGAGLLMRSFYLLKHVELGFDPGKILFAVIGPTRGHDEHPDRTKIGSPEWQATLQKDIERIKTLPGIVDVAVNNTIPGYGPSRGPQVTVPGSTRTEEAGLDECDANCPRTLGLRMIRGDWFSAESVRSGEYVAVVSERLAKDFFGDGNPVGQQLLVKGFRIPPKQPQDAYFRIIGVVKDVKNAGLQQPAIPMAFIPPLITGGLVLQIRTAVDPASMIHAVQQRVWAEDPDEVFWYCEPLTNFLQRLTYETPELAVKLSWPLAALAFLLLVVGVFSVMAYSVSQRTQEIGVRMALGAQQASVIRMILSRGGLLISAGTLIGLLASYATMRFLADQIWGISVTDPWTYAAAVVLIALAGVAACVIPARRAAKVDPLVALHYE